MPIDLVIDDREGSTATTPKTPPITGSTGSNGDTQPNTEPNTEVRPIYIFLKSVYILRSREIF